MKENQYAKEIFILSNKLKRLLDKKHSINGLYVGQARVLVYLFNNKENKIYQKDIENTFQIRGGTVTGLIDTLVNNKYIVRVESETDKRKRKIVLTKDGEELAVKSMETIRTVENGLQSALTKEENEVFKKISQKINKWIDEEENK
ncbi:MAG TPA: winged helix-turn-helix transcriptional regulator [Acholeplasma sp.]|nr:winged helix-turn-helix transcriptional regulator [Acholeplasma sp.]